MNELVTKSLAQIVNTDHRAAAIFEKYHLDFCCKGKRALGQACEEKNIPVEDVLAELEHTTRAQSSSPVNYDNFTVAQLATYIEMTHHSFVKKEIPAILSYLEKIAGKHGDRHPEMIAVLRLFNGIKEEMERHLQTEETVVFPAIKEMELAGNRSGTNSPYLFDTIGIMEKEHDHAGNLLAEIRKVTNNFTLPADACTTYRLSYAALEAFEFDLHTHVHLENNILFPKVLKMVSQSGSCSLN